MQSSAQLSSFHQFRGFTGHFFVFLLMGMAVFLMSATNYLKMPVLIFSLLLILCLARPSLLSVNDAVLFSICAVFYIFYFLISGLHRLYFFNEYSLLETSIKFLLNLFFFVGTLFFLRRRDSRSVMNFAISSAILLHVALLLWQAMGLYLFNVHYDFLNMIMGGEQRIKGNAGFSGLYRLPGIYNEPGTYSVFMFLLCFCKYCVSRNLGIIFVLGMASTLFTFSIQAVVTVVLFFSIVSFVGILKILLSLKASFRNVLFFIWGGAIAVVLVFFMYDYLYGYISARFFSAPVSSDGTISIRYFEAFRAYSELEIFSMLSGVGFDIDALQVLIADTGLIFSVVVQFGILGVAGLVFMLYCLRRDFKAVLLFLFILTSKLSLIYPLMWYAIALVVFYRNESNHTKNNIVDGQRSLA